MRHGALAVNCFMIISGFVIFMLLDQKKEHYGFFILRRFFRIFPVYPVLFLLALPCLFISHSLSRENARTRLLLQGWNKALA